MKYHLFTFSTIYPNKSSDDHVVEWCRKHHIKWRYNENYEIVADVYNVGKFYRFKVEHIVDNLCGVYVCR